MDSREVVIVNHDGRENWESVLIRGALWYHGIPSKIAGFNDLPECQRHTLVVITRKDTEIIENLPRFDTSECNVFLAGRSVTYEYLQGKLSPQAGQILIYGEPYALITKLVLDPKLMDALRGKASFGPLLHPTSYRAPRSDNAHDEALILTSLGCQKKCGYCSYGATFASLYGKRFRRRSRPWMNIFDEIVDSLERGIERFIIVADQFLAREPEQNREIELLSKNWHSDRIGRVTLVFTCSPADLMKNRSLIKLMSQRFDLHPILSIDSLDEKTLDLFDLDFDPPVALKAARFLSSLRLPFRINYIFVRPGVTLEGIQEEFRNLRSLAAMTTYMSSHQKLALAQDIFLETLQIKSCSPLSRKPAAKKFLATIKGSMPIRLLPIIEEAAKREREALRRDGDSFGSSDPLQRIVESGFREVQKWKS